MFIRVNCKTDGRLPVPLLYIHVLTMPDIGSVQQSSTIIRAPDNNYLYMPHIATLCYILGHQCEWVVGTFQIETTTPPQPCSDIPSIHSFAYLVSFRSFLYIESMVLHGNPNPSSLDSD